MGVYENLTSKYGGKKSSSAPADNNSLKVKSSPYEQDPTGNSYQDLLAKYGSGESNVPQISKVTNTPDNQGEITSVTNAPNNNNQKISISPNSAPPAPSEQPSIFDKVKSFFGVKPKDTSEPLRFNIDDSTLQKVIAKTEQDPLVQKFHHGDEGTQIEKVGTQFMSYGLNAFLDLLPRKFLELAAAPGSIEDQYLRGMLDPDNTAEQIAAFSGASLGKVLQFEVAAPLVTKQLARIPGFTEFAGNYPKLAQVISGGLTFGTLGLGSDVAQQRSAGQTLRDIPGNLLTGAGFGASEFLKPFQAAGTVFGTSFAGSKISGETNAGALTTSVINTLFFGGARLLDQINTKQAFTDLGLNKNSTLEDIRNASAGESMQLTTQLIDLARQNAYKTLDLKPGASETDLKEAYRAKASQTHPDVNSSGAEKFVEVSSAYKFLKDAPADQMSFVQEVMDIVRAAREGRNILTPRADLVAAREAAAANQPQKQITGEVAKEPAVKEVTPEQKIVETQKAELAQKSQAEVRQVFQSPITETIAKRAIALAQENLPAFGRQIEDSIKSGLPNANSGKGENPIGGKNGLVFLDQPSKDGRPAQVNAKGEIEIFLPNFQSDIKALIAGTRLLLHEGPNTTIFQRKAGESVEALTSRYAREIVMHEVGHQKTQTLEETAALRQKTMDVAMAKATGNRKIMQQTQAELNKILKNLESKANDYVAKNRATLEQQLGEVKFPSSEKKAELAKTERNPDKQTFLQKTGDKIKSVVSKKIEQAKITEEKQTIRKELIQKKNEAVAAAVQETRSTYQKIVNRLRDRREELESIRQDLYDYATTFLPLSERGKFLGAVKNTSNREEMQQVIQSMNKVADIAERRKLVGEIKKELSSTKIKKQNGLPNVKFEKSAQEKLNFIRANVSSSREIAQSKKFDLIADYQSKNPDTQIPEEILAQAELLDMVGIKEMDRRELEQTLFNIRSIKETGRMKKELERFNFDTKIQQIKDVVKDIITGGKPLPSDSQFVRQTKSKSASEKIKKFLTTDQYAWEDLLDSLSEFDKSSKPYESKLSKLGERAHVALVTENKAEIEQAEKIIQAVRKIYNITKNKEMLQLYEDLQKLQSLGTFRGTDGVTREIQLTRDQAIKKWMELQDPTLKESFTEGLHWSDEVIKAVTNFLTPQDIEYAKWQLQFYRDYYKEVNEVFSKEFGIDLPFSENYSPIKRDVETLIPENVLLSQESAKYASVRNGSLKARVKNIIDLKPVGSTETILGHIQKMEHYKSWSETMGIYRRVFQDKQIRMAIRDFHGDDYLKSIDRFLEDFARGGVAREKIYPVIDKLRSNVTKGLLGLNINVAKKQLVGVLDYAMELPIDDFASGVADFWSSPIKKSKFLFANSPGLQERFGEGFERDIKFAIQKGIDQKLSKTKNISEYFFIPLRNADKITVYQGAWASYRSKYNELKKSSPSMSEEELQKEAIKYAEIVTNRVQESGQLNTLAPLQREGSLAKLFTMFQSQPNKYYRIIVGAGRNWRSGRGSKADNARKILFAWFIVPMIYQFVADGFSVDKKHQLRTALLGPFANVLITGQILQSMFGWATGEKYPFQASPVFSLLNDLQQGITNLFSDKWGSHLTYLIDAMGKTVGLPTLMFTRPIRNSLRGDKGSSSNTKQKKSSSKVTF